MYGIVLRRIDRKQQQGMTTLGLIILVSFVSIFAFAFLRLTPVYLNYLKIVGVIDGVHEEFDGAGATAAQIKTSVRRRFDIESVGQIEARDVKMEAVDGGYKISAIYDHTAPFIANVYFTVKFDKSVIIRR
jgi:hypothetical protein